MPATRIGDRIFHWAFGKGTVSAIDGVNLAVAFDVRGDKRVPAESVQQASTVMALGRAPRPILSFPAGHTADIIRLSHYRAWETRWPTAVYIRSIAADAKVRVAFP